MMTGILGLASDTGSTHNTLNGIKNALVMEIFVWLESNLHKQYKATPVARAEAKVQLHRSPLKASKIDSQRGALVGFKFINTQFSSLTKPVGLIMLNLLALKIRL